MNSYKEIEHLHINTGGKELTQEQIEEAKSFIDSQGFKDMIREAKESRQRVMESKITDRTKMWLIAPIWCFNININKGEIDMKKAILTLSLIFITYYLTFKYMWIKELKY